MSNPLPPCEFVSIKEFAAKIGMHPNTIRRAINAKKIVAMRVGSGKRAAYRIPMTELSRLIFFDLEKYVCDILEAKTKQME